MGNSRLAVKEKLSHNHSGKRVNSIDRITPHCYVGNVSTDAMLNYFSNLDLQASANYVIGVNGDIGLCVNEDCRAWTSSSSENDHRAVTIECACDRNPPYEFNTSVYNSLIRLCADICARNGKKKLLWINDKKKALSYKTADDEMLITVHRWFANKSCPGDWLIDKLGDFAEQVTAQLSGGENGLKKLYKVQSGAFKKIDNAKRLQQRLSEKGYAVFIKECGGYYKVQLGAFSDKQNALNLAAKLKNDGFASFVATED